MFPYFLWSWNCAGELVHVHGDCEAGRFVGSTALVLRLFQVRFAGLRRESWFRTLGSAIALKAMS